MVLEASQQLLTILSLLVSSPRSNFVDFLLPLDDAVLGVGAFAPRENGKKLVLDDNIDPANIVAIVNKKAEKKKVLFDPSLEYVASKEINSTSAPLPPTQTNSIHPGSGPGLINSIPSSAAAIKNGYYISPTLETLKGMSKESLKTVHNLVIGRKGFGEVKFEKPVDLSESGRVS
ncbi:hypothetical protein G6F68_011175 [Rhizopus microsporus]|nr:hypothetical protein G6F68_011175 [Rhizopus microsporus]